MKKYLIVFVILLSGCMSLFVEEAKIIKWPTIGIESTTNVGGHFFTIHRWRGYYTDGEEIFYNGLAGNIMKVSFHEFSREVSEKDSGPTSNYEFTINSFPAEITVQQYHIKILSADNNHASFILISGKSFFDNK